MIIVVIIVIMAGPARMIIIVVIRTVTPARPISMRIVIVIICAACRNPAICEIVITGPHRNISPAGRFFVQSFAFRFQNLPSGLIHDHLDLVPASGRFDLGLRRPILDLNMCVTLRLKITHHLIRCRLRPGLTGQHCQCDAPSANSKMLNNHLMSLSIVQNP